MFLNKSDFYRREVTPSNLCVRPFGRHNRYLDYSSSEVLEYSPEVPVWYESTHLRYQRVSRGLNWGTSEVLKHTPEVTVRYRVFIRYCVFFFKMLWWKTKRGQSPEYILTFSKKTFNEHPVLEWLKYSPKEPVWTRILAWGTSEVLEYSTEVPVKN